MADASVVGGHPRPVDELGAGGVGGVAEAEQVGRLAVELVVPDRQRRNPHAATDEHRAPPCPRGGEADPQRADERQVVAGPQLAQAPGSGADVLDHELELVVTRPTPRAQNAERPGQERALALSPAPSLRGAQHVELSGLRARTGRVGAAQDGVGAVALGGRHAGGARAERRPDAVGDGGAHCEDTAPAGRLRCSSCSETTSGSPRRAAMIARAAARPPDMVVMHGMPWVIAAERIS